MPVAQKQRATEEDPRGGAVTNDLPRAEIKGEPLADEARPGLFRVLLVEDEPTLMELYGSVLSKRQVRLEQSGSGHDALEKLSATPYDLVICDLNLPGVDGIFLLQWIQRHRPATTAIVISGDGSPERILAAMRAGAKDYLVKPFLMPELKAMFERWCQPQIPSQREPFSSLMQQVMNDVRAEMTPLASTLEQIEQGNFGAMDAGVRTALLAMGEKIEQLRMFTEDYSRMATNLLQGNGSFATERLGLRDEIITPVLAEMRETLQRKGITVSRGMGIAKTGDAYVTGNRLMLRSAFRILFYLASRHCPAQGLISYEITSNGRRYKVQLAIDGEIRPNPEQERSGDELIPARQEEGLGLGLALAKDILRQHGGDIWHESFALGAKVVFTLPLAAEPPAGVGDA